MADTAWTADVGGSLLALDHVSAAYGPFRAVFDVSFAIPPGRALALLGPNGAGKTTIARVCSGLVTPTEGSVRFDGSDVTGRPAHVLARLGISHAPEGRSVFASLSVEENLSLGFRSLLGAAGARQALAEAYALFPKLGDRRTQVAGSLSGGEQRMLSLARVLVNPPKLLIVDELSLGLAPIIVDEVYRQLAAIKNKGTSLLIVEQHVEHALALADEVGVLAQGVLTYLGEVLPVDQLARYLLPTTLDPAPSTPPGPTPEPVAEVVAPGTDSATGSSEAGPG
jgi:branched-chain amino acid transport system ATP-binding protein